MKIPVFLSTEGNSIGNYLCTIKHKKLHLLLDEIAPYWPDRIITAQMRSANHGGGYRWVLALDATQMKPPTIPTPDDRMICEEPALPWED